MGRDENIKVFNDTESLSKTKYAKDVEASIEGQVIIKETDDIGNVPKDKYEEKAKVNVSRKRTCEAAKVYVADGEKVVIHNFASAVNPGGGVVKGATAQEESICRISTAYPCLTTESNRRGFYNLHRALQDRIYNDDIIYTPDVVVFKSDTSNPVKLPDNEVYKVNIITCAAPNLNSRNMRNDTKYIRKVTDKELLAIHVKRLRRILDVAIKNGNECIILGAFGCGAFMNNPEVVARAAREVVTEYRYAFKNIEFAVYCSSKDTRNYDVFARVMRGM